MYRVHRTVSMYDLHSVITMYTLREKHAHHQIFIRSFKEKVVILVCTQMSVIFHILSLGLTAHTYLGGRQL